MRKDGGLTLFSHFTDSYLTPAGDSVGDCTSGIGTGSACHPTVPAANDLQRNGSKARLDSCDCGVGKETCNPRTPLPHGR